MRLIPHGITPPEFLDRESARSKIPNSLREPEGSSLRVRASPLDSDSGCPELAEWAESRTEPRTAKFQIPNSILIGTIANFYPTKGLSYLIEAAAKLKTKHNFQIVIIGDGIERTYLESLITKYNLEENIILAGQIPEAAKYLKAFDIFVLPSIKEGLPYAILEAMAAGLPIVATNVGGISEMITDNESGLLVPPKNPEALAEALKKLIDAPELRARLGQNAAATAAAKFSLKEMLKKTRQIYL